MTEIHDIFANETLFAVKYEGKGDNELKRLQSLWNDPLEVRNFAKRNAGELLKQFSVAELSEMIRAEAEYIDDALKVLQTDKTKKLNDFFVPLNDKDSELIPLGKKKGKKTEGLTFLRLYAIQIEVDNNCYLITGGAIKMSDVMGGADDTERARNQLDIWRGRLKAKNVKNKSDFFEFIKEYS